MLTEDSSIDHHAHWSDVKKRLDSDSRYKAVESSTQREDWFRDHLHDLKEERRRQKRREKEKKRAKRSRSRSRSKGRSKSKDKRDAGEREESEDEKHKEKHRDDAEKSEVRRGDAGDGRGAGRDVWVGERFSSVFHFHVCRESRKSSACKVFSVGCGVLGYFAVFHTCFISVGFRFTWLRVCPQDVDSEEEEERKKKETEEREKRERMETSLREREKEVQRTLAEHLRDRDKVTLTPPPSLTVHSMML